MTPATQQSAPTPVPAAGASAAIGNERNEFLTFALGAESYGIEILKVQEIRGYEAVTSIPNAPPFLKGVINLRGTIVPIVDLRIKLNFPNVEYNRFTVVIILNVANRVLLVTFSEFGRRVAENGGPTIAGTDHGAAAPLFVVGNGVAAAPGGGHVFGRLPPLDAGLLDGGRNLAYHTDFRSVYATVISKWLDADPVAVLGGGFPTDVGFLG